jgi:hypothetical protein
MNNINLMPDTAIERDFEVMQDRFEADLNLELQGVYHDDNAAEMSCIRDSLMNCNPGKCMAWRRVDAQHGYCVIIGCSWREGVPL